MERVDILIVGGGAAGLSAAGSLLEASDCRVLMLEARAAPREPAARFTPLDFVRANRLEAALLQTYSSFVAHSPLGALARFDYGRAVLASLDYARLCELLQERCQKSPNFALRMGEAVSLSPSPPRQDAPLSVQLADDQVIQAQLLIDASGAHQWAAGQLGLRGSAHFSVCAGEVRTGVVSDDDETLRLLMPNRHFGSGGGWFYPLTGQRASLGYALLLPTEQRRVSSPWPGYQAMRTGLQPYADWTASSQVEYEDGGMIPVGRIARFVDHRVLIVGDAAGQAHPWTVEGVRPAVLNGQACGRFAAAALREKRFERGFLHQYEMDWNRRNRKRFWRAASLVEIAWGSDDERRDHEILRYAGIAPEKQLGMLLENQASWFEQAYAVAGYLRRSLVRRVR